jgi:hypothetical protein
MKEESFEDSLIDFVNEEFPFGARNEEVISSLGHRRKSDKYWHGRLELEE